MCTVVSVQYLFLALLQLTMNSIFKFRHFNFMLSFIKKLKFVSIARNCSVIGLSREVNYGVPARNFGVMGCPYELSDGVLAGDQSCLAKAISLCESTRVDHQELFEIISKRMLGLSSIKKDSLRVGVCGPPGAGI